MRLADRIARSLPAASYELEALVRLVGVEETESVPTAAVTCRSRARLLINPTFVETHCRRDEHLFLLVMHEMWHVLLGHTTLYPRPTPRHNIAFDALINAGLSRQHPEPAYRGFFESLNSAEVFPQLLLRPPVGWPRRPNYDVSGPPGTKEILERLYPRPGTTQLEPLYDELFALLDTAGHNHYTDDVELLGDHGDSSDAMQDPLFGDVVRRIVAKWPPPPFVLQGRDDGRPFDGWQVEQAHVERRLHTQFAQILRRVLQPGRGALSSDYRTPITCQVGPGPLLNSSDRLLAARRALLGDHALANQRITVLSRSPEPPTRALVYLDVSGSMSSIIPQLLGLLVPVVRAGRAIVQQFSTEVSPLTVDDLLRGSLTTTVGTDIRCVLNDIASRRENRALIVTDGYVGVPTDSDIVPLRERGVVIHTVLPASGWADDLAPHSIIHRLDLREDG